MLKFLRRNLKKNLVLTVHTIRRKRIDVLLQEIVL